MKYIIMCGGSYDEWETPRQLEKVRGEPIVMRTIRLLRENGVREIFISSNDPRFENCGALVIHHDNPYHARKMNDVDGHWCDCFYPTFEPACYIFGDVVFSPEAIRTIVETETDGVEFFGSAKPFAPEYTKKWVEPFAFKVEDQERFHAAVEKLKELDDKCWRKPISWDLWALIQGRRIDIDDYVVDYKVINDYTCDVDHKKDIAKIKRRMP